MSGTMKIVGHWIPDVGLAYGPPGEGPFPAVMILHGSEGAWAGWSHAEAMLFAAHGFLALPFGYSKGGNIWNAGSIIDVALDDTAAALVKFRGAALCGPKLGLYGVSRGAEHALLVTSLMVRAGDAGVPDAVGAHAPPDVICGAFDGATWRDRGDPGWRAWDPGERAWTWRGSSDELLPTAPIEIERYPGPLFLSHGTEDELWSVAMTQRLADRLHRHDRRPEIHYYEGQGHVPMGDAANAHYAHVIGFFARHLI